MPQIVVTYPILTSKGEKISKTMIVEFAVGQIVVVRVDTDKVERMVIGWYVTEQGVRYDIFPHFRDTDRYFFNIELELVEDL